MPGVTQLKSRWCLWVKVASNGYPQNSFFFFCRVAWEIQLNHKDPSLLFSQAQTGQRMFSIQYSIVPQFLPVGRVQGAVCGSWTLWSSSCCSPSPWAGRPVCWWHCPAALFRGTLCFPCYAWFIWALWRWLGKADPEVSVLIPELCLGLWRKAVKPKWIGMCPNASLNGTLSHRPWKTIYKAKM